MIFFFITFFRQPILMMMYFLHPQLFLDLTYSTSYFLLFLTISLSKKKIKIKNQSKLKNKHETKQTQKEYQNKKHIKYGVHFMLANYSWAQSRPQSAVDIPRDTPLGKTGFPFPSKDQLQIVFYLGRELCVQLPISMLGFLSDLSLCRPCTCRHGFCEFICVSAHLCLHYVISLESPITYGSQNLLFFSSLLCRSQSLEAQDLINTSHLGLSAPKSLSL